MPSLDVSEQQIQVSTMNPDNATKPVTEFILLGFPSLEQKNRILLCILLSLAYTVTLAGNLCIVWAVVRDPRLNCLPMYVLLGNFSFLETCYVTATVPRMISDLATPQGDVISFHGCFLQFYFFFSMGAAECFSLAAMALDRYLAICHPLHYSSFMSQQPCLVLVASCWFLGFLWFIVPIVLISKVPFCGPNILDHFMCDPVLLLATFCIPAPRTKLSCYVLCCLLIFTTFLFILTSYVMVLREVFRLPEGSGRRKAFSTCTSHLAIVGLFYTSVMATYIIPSAPGSNGKVVTLFYVLVTPLLNPLIYSLRNREMKEALRRTLLGKR
ncbi:olfactory receptor 11H6 [Alligator mississippiensis]|uniref:olfactory receptor 11H6 n=1 Tax=Alligator mississippiensis TaxID=8496 RepID=UPI0028775B1F|nr:olfactory receptor 11H6 [Alligator mississippiensis]